jgi:hypothetical protein
MKTEPGRIASNSGKQGAVSAKNGKLIWVVFGLVGLAFAVAPSWGQQLDPVKGPMALQAPGPFYEGTKGTGAYSYSIKSDFGRVKTFSYASGETLKGKSEWVTASAADAQTPATPGSSQQNLAVAWDLVYGKGYYASHVAGNKILHGTFTGEKGTILQVESLDNYVAVGADNQGNLYKIVW